jgi:hypothetical protein
MKYFLHDSNSFNDEKVTELFMAYGYEGLGLFYTALEKFAQQEKPIKTAVLKKQLNIGKKLDKCWSFMESIGLISSNNGESFNKQLLKFSENYKIKKEKTAERLKQWRENQYVAENVTHSEHVRNASKVKISKVNRSKVKVNTNSVELALTKKHSFENSIYFEKKIFKEAFPDWEREKLAKYYESALLYSQSKGVKYLNWAAAIKNWEKRDNQTIKNGKSEFEKNRTAVEQRIRQADQYIAEVVFGNNQRINNEQSDSIGID